MIALSLGMLLGVMLKLGHSHIALRTENGALKAANRAIKAGFRARITGLEARVAAKEDEGYDLQMQVEYKAKELHDMTVAWETMIGHLANLQLELADKTELLEECESELDEKMWEVESWRCNVVYLPFLFADLSWVSLEKFMCSTSGSSETSP